ncbi:hypothetical protein [Acinetobacter sp. V2]|nr:hypothetical protein [Acinetobacter sp. V2]KKC44651.1 hypothetical protein UC75_03575 [Acinetobacter sp. V2]
MNSNIIFLDDTPSLRDEEIVDHFASNISKLSETFLAIKKIRPDIQIHMNTRFFELRISESIILQNISKQLQNTVKEELLSFKVNLQKNPYSLGSDSKLESYWGMQVLYNQHPYDSLIWTYLLDSLVISFDKKLLNWNTETIEAQLLNIEDEDVGEENIEIRHACNPHHVKIYHGWFSTFENPPKLEEFLESPNNFLSQIKLLDEAKDNIRELRNFYTSIYNTLATVNSDLLNWDQQSEIAFSLKNAGGEHKKRKQVLDDAGLKGYEAHFFFTGIAGRIHYKLIGNTVEVKYIGKKIGV